MKHAENRIPKHVKLRLRELGINQLMLAEKSGISSSTISNWINGVVMPYADNIKKLAAALDVSPLWLTKGGDDRQLGLGLDEKELDRQIKQAMKRSGEQKKQAGRRLKERVALKGVKTVDLMLAIRVSKPTIMNWYNGRSEPNAAVLKKLAIILDTTQEWIRDGLGDSEASGDLSELTIGSRIKKQLIKLDISQQELVKKTNASKGAVSKWVNSTSVPTPYYLFIIANFLQTSPYWLQTGNELPDGEIDEVQEAFSHQSFLPHSKKSDDIDNMEVGKRIKQCLVNRGWSASELSRETGVTKGAISKWIHGLALPRAGGLVKTAKALNTNANWLLYGTGDDSAESLDAQKGAASEEGAAIGERIQRRLSEIGLTQKDLAKSLGVSVTTITNWISGKAVPQAEFIIKAACVLDTTASFLMYGDDLLVTINKADAHS